MLDQRQTIANLVLDHSECAEVFQRHHIDFCCRGEATVEAAAKAKGLEVGVLVEELSRAIAARQEQSTIDPRQLTTSELVAHIVGKHHAFLRRSLPLVQRLAAKVKRAHGARNPKLAALEVAVTTLVDALTPHLDEEERELFPRLIAEEGSEKLRELLASMFDDHHAVARLLEQIRAAADDFSPPPWACNSYRTLLSELEALERDTFAHVHLENHALAPRFAAV